jgi:ArsR family transcriptional regulator
MEELTNLFKVLSDETRLRIINLLFYQKLCVCELVEILNASQPKISKHISRIKGINILTTEKNEQYTYYSLNRQNTELLHIIEHVLTNTTNKTLSSDISNMNMIETFVCTR